MTASPIMTKTDLVAALQDRAGYRREQADALVEMIFDTIAGHFQSGGIHVTLRGFGTFTARQRKVSRTTNPKTGKPLEIAPRLSVTFRQSPEFKKRINPKN